MFDIYICNTNIKDIFTPQQIDNLLKLSIKDFQELGFKIVKRRTKWLIKLYFITTLKMKFMIMN